MGNIMVSAHPHRPGWLFGVLLAGLCTLMAARSAWAEMPVDKAALARLESRARETGSDGVIVYVDGKKVLDYRTTAGDQPMDLMSSTKSIVGLAVMKAIEDGKIKSIDEPVADFFPEWAQGRKKSITIRMLLNMTSGLQNIGSGNEVYAAPDSVKLALAAELQSAPGLKFDYNNKSVNLLTGIIHAASGELIDDYVQEHFLDPMGITDWRWIHDTAGNPYGMADLLLRAEDFIKFGLLMLQNGQWDGKPLLSAKSIAEIGKQSQPYEPLYGLLWWRIPSSVSGVVTDKHLADLASGGLDPVLLSQIKALQGRTFHSENEWHRALAQAVPNWLDRMFVPGLIGPYGLDVPTWSYGGFDGFATQGYLGQYLVVFPERHLTAVRMIRPFASYDFMTNRFEDFADRVRDVVAMAPAPAADKGPPTAPK